MLQRGLSVYVYAQPGQGTWDLAKAYFGRVISMAAVSDMQSAMNEIRSDTTAIAVLPWPSDEDSIPWWVQLAYKDESDRPLRIVTALPFGGGVPLAEAMHRALVVGRMDFMPSGDDHSFLVVQSDQVLSRARLLGLVKDQGLKTLSIVMTNSGQESCSALMCVEGYITQDHDALAGLEKALGADGGQCHAIGVSCAAGV